MDDAGMVAEDSSEGVPKVQPAADPFKASARPSMHSEAVANENKIIAYFSRGAGLSAAGVSGDTTAIAYAVVNHVAGVQALDDGKERRLWFTALVIVLCQSWVESYSALFQGDCCSLE